MGRAAEVLKDLGLPANRQALAVDHLFQYLGAKRLAVLKAQLESKSVPAIAADNGLTPSDVRAIMVSPQYRSALREIESNIQIRERFDLEQAHDMLMRAYTEADDPATQVRATEALVKLHGLDREDSGRTIDVNGIEVVDYEAMSDEELARLEAAEGSEGDEE